MLLCFHSLRCSYGLRKSSRAFRYPSRKLGVHTTTHFLVTTALLIFMKFFPKPKTFSSICYITFYTCFLKFDEFYLDQLFKETLCFKSDRTKLLVLEYINIIIPISNIDVYHPQIGNPTLFYAKTDTPVSAIKKLICLFLHLYLGQSLLKKCKGIYRGEFYCSKLL